ncbi:hypothetical protein V8G54_034347 [Vigna mungo]|uniref:Uncharacterized protein n=1 Tax=Vigna mungo TaxID=3915 RepID=A0AAQ3MPJ6_VIGMU
MISSDSNKPQCCGVVKEPSVFSTKLRREASSSTPKSCFALMLLSQSEITLRPMPSDLPAVEQGCFISCSLLTVSPFPASLSMLFAALYRVLQLSVCSRGFCSRFFRSCNC